METLTTMGQTAGYSEDSFSAHLARAALRAISLRRSAPNLSARALPPLLPPRRPSSAAVFEGGGILSTRGQSQAATSDGDSPASNNLLGVLDARGESVEGRRFAGCVVHSFGGGDVNIVAVAVVSGTTYAVRHDHLDLRLRTRSTEKKAEAGPPSSEPASHPALEGAGGVKHQ